MIKLGDFFDSGFQNSEQILEVVRASTDFDPEVEDLGDAETMLIFKTSKQQTWLIATSERLYCILDDTDRGFTRLTWSLPKADLLQGDQLVNLNVNEQFKKNTGTIDFPGHKQWLYSKKLFEGDPTMQIGNAIEAKMSLPNIEN